MWAAKIGGWRSDMAKSQAEAVDIMKKAGITIVDPSAAVLEATRKKLMGTQDAVTKELKLDPALVAEANAALGISGKS
jgi:hypothetical protein